MGPHLCSLWRDPLDKRILVTYLTGIIDQSKERPVPRALTPAEREDVVRTLKQSGRRRFVNSGVRKTSISELAGDAGIGKGTFYLFFDSKEALYLALQEEDEQAIRAELVKELYALQERPREMFRRYLSFHFEVYANYPLLQVLWRPGEQEAIERKLPPQLLEDQRQSRREFFTGLVQLFIDEGLVTEESPERLANFGEAAFALCQQQEQLGERVFAGFVDLLVDGLTVGLMRRAPSAT